MTANEMLKNWLDESKKREREKKKIIDGKWNASLFLW